MIWPPIFVMPPLPWIAAFVVIVALFALIAYLRPSPARARFTGSREQYVTAITINATLVFAPLFLWLAPVVRFEADSYAYAASASMVAFMIYMVIAYILLRLARALPVTGPLLRKLDIARLQAVLDRLTKAEGKS